jgi:O-antigen/teichoic acid export membrane protein
MIAGSAISIAKNLAFAKVLPVDAFGLLSLFKVISTYGASILNIGLVNGLNRELPVSLGRGNEERAANLRNMVITFLTFFMIPVSVLYSAVVWFGAPSLQIRGILIGALVAAVVSLAYQITTLELRSRQLQVYFALVYVIQSVLILGIGVLAGTWYGVIGIMAAVILGNVGSTAVVWIFWLRDFQLVCVRVQEFKYLLSIGVPLLLSSLGGSFILTMDRLFIARAFGTFELGQYQFAALIVTGGRVLAGAIGMWIMPKILYDHGRGLSPARNLCRLLLIMGGILAIFLIALYPSVGIVSILIERFFPKYIPALPLLSPLFLSAGFITANVAGFMLNALNRQRLGLSANAFVAVLLFISYIVASQRGASLRSFAVIFMGGQILAMCSNLALVLWCLREDLEFHLLRSEVFHILGIITGKSGG